jgi:hypothetical protein
MAYLIINLEMNRKRMHVKYFGMLQVPFRTIIFTAFNILLIPGLYNITLEVSSGQIVATNLYNNQFPKSKLNLVQIIFILCICSISQSTELMSLSAAVSHFLNCFLSSYPVPHPHQVADEVIQLTIFMSHNKQSGKMKNT